MTAQLWEVTGGADKGGILVREGQETASKALDDRLATGALVKQLSLAGQRLQFELLKGAGPSTGWVSLAVSGKPLLVESSISEEVIKLNWAPATPLVSYDTPKVEKIPQNLIDGNTPFDNKNLQKVSEASSKNLPGVHFNMTFPHTAEQIEEYGAEWLTKGFHAAGTLPADNRVKQIVKIRGFPGGGAGLKAELVVEYEKPDENLHTDLFVKMPHPINTFNRPVLIQMKLEPSELIFNRYYVKCLPFRAPKYYFGDWNEETSNWILISEKIAFASTTTRGQRQAPFRFEAPVLKAMDWTLNDKAEKYYALWRSAALLGAWAHNGKLGAQIDGAFQRSPKVFAIFPMPEKMFKKFADQTSDFILNVAPGFFPSDVANAEFVEKLEVETKEVHKSFAIFSDYLTANGQEAWGFVHPNVNSDNAFYWVDEEGRTDAGLLDWGGMMFAAFATTLSSNLMVTDADVRVGHLAGMCDTFVKTMTEFGGPKINAEYFYRHALLNDMKTVCTGMTMFDSRGMGIYDNKPRDDWKSCTNFTDPEWVVEDVATMMTRAPVVWLVEGVKAWKAGEYYKKFMALKEACGKKQADAKKK